MATRYDCELVSSHASFKNGIKEPLSHVIKPKIKKRQPTKNKEVAYEFLLFDCISLVCS